METVKCLTPECVKPAHSRGICQTCYAAAHHAVNRGKTTWEHLEAMGLVLTKAKRGRKVGGKFLKTFEGAVQESLQQESGTPADAGSTAIVEAAAEPVAVPSNI